MRVGGIAVAALAVAAGCGGSAQPEARSIAVEELALPLRGDVVPAYVVAAPSGERRGAVVYLHGQGGSREQLLDQARKAAARGAVAVTITAPSSAAPPPTEVAAELLEQERETAWLDVAAVRAAVDYLVAREDVDPRRIGFVGWSAGARTGAFVSGHERRIRAFVLMAGGAEPVSAYVEQAPPELRDDVRRVLSEIDPLTAMATSRARFLIQNGEADEVVPRHALEQLAAAAPGDADVRWYDAGHGLDEAALRDQLDWLERELALPGA